MKKLVIIILLFASVALYGQDDLMQNRLNNIGSDIALTYNPAVQSRIDALLLNKNQSTGQLLGKSAYYLEVIGDSLKSHNMPEELKYLAAALSGYNNWVVSEDGGSGFWQLRYGIAKKYGLRINSYIDERRDFHKSTSAAIQYLSDLYKEFNDWPLAIAAFYSDEFEVNKAIRKANGKYTYWSIHNELPLRHQKAVPAYTAVVYIHYYHDKHSLKVEEYTPEDVRVVAVKQWTTIYQLSQALEVSYGLLKDLNPIFKKQVIPHTSRQYPVSIPTNKVERFNFLGDSLYTYPEHEIVAGVVEPPKQIIPEPRVVEPAGRNTGTTRTTTNSSGKKTVYYTVRGGDYLGRIADMYDVGLSSMKKWNNLRSDRINAGQKLKVYVPASKYDYYKKINSMTASQKRAVMNKD